MTALVAALAAVAGVGTLLIGAAAAWAWDLPRRVVAGVVAFGAGLLIATLTLELVSDAHESGGVWPVVIGFAVGAVAYVAGDWGVTRLVGRAEARSRNATARRGGESPDGGTAYAVGALLDGVPEALVIGLTAATGGFPVAAVLAIGMSNVAEGLAGTVPLKKSGRPARAVFGLWAAITAVATVAAVVGALAMQSVAGEAHAIMVAFAAGALLAMVVNAMVPEAVESDHAASGLVATAGFLVAFAIYEVL